MRNAVLLGLGVGLASGCYEGVGDPASPLGTFGTVPVDEDALDSGAEDPDPEPEDGSGAETGGEEPSGDGMGQRRHLVKACPAWDPPSSSPSPQAKSASTSAPLPQPWRDAPSPTRRTR